MAPFKRELTVQHIQSVLWSPRFLFISFFSLHVFVSLLFDKSITEFSSNSPTVQVTKGITYRGKIHSLTSRTSPPLRYAHLSSNPTHRSSLVTYPVYCHVSTGFALVKTCRHHARSESTVIDIFNPRHSGIMDMRHVTCVHVIDSNLDFNGFVRIENERFKRNYFAVGVPQGWDMWHVATPSLEWKPWKTNKDLR